MICVERTTKKAEFIKIALWESKAFKDDQQHYGDYLYQLKGWECWTRSNTYIKGDSEFELGAIDLEGLS